MSGKAQPPNTRQSVSGLRLRAGGRFKHLLVKDNQAVVELHSLATAKNGLKFDNRYCWVCRFANGTIVEVRAYLNSALVARLFAENPI